MRLKSDPVTGSKTQSWLRLCRKIKDNSRFITAPFRETKAFEKLFNAGFNTSKKIATLDIKEVRKIPNLTMSDFYIISDLWELVKKNNNKTAQLFIEFLSGYKEKGNDSK